MSQATVRAGEIERISYGQLRAILREGFEGFLRFIPDGDAPMLALAYDEEGTLRPLSAEARAPLHILRDFVCAVGTLGRGRAMTEVGALLITEGVAQMIISGDERWAQRFVD